MKGSLIVVGFFALGCLLGWSGYLPGVIIENDITVYVLYLLMFQVGISIGSDKKLKEILSSIRPKLLLVPLATIIGTLSFSALIGGLHGSVFRFFLLFDVSERGFRDLGNHLARLKSRFRGLGRHFTRLKSHFRGLEKLFYSLQHHFYRSF